MAPARSGEIGSLHSELRDALVSSEVCIDHPLGALTTYRVGGDAQMFVEVESSADLEALASVVRLHRVAVASIGRGSNLLVSDDGFDGLVIRLGSAFETVEELEDFGVRVGAASSLPAVARRVTAQGLTGFEWAVGVPGSIGGAVRMNAGGHGSDMAACVSRARVVSLGSGVASIVENAELRFGYRSSAIGGDDVVEWAELQLSEGDPVSGEELLSEIVRWRREHQPGGQNAGSVFTNPDNDSAGRLIDQAGLKGTRIGSAEVSVKHANFIQVDQYGRASDVVELMRAIVQRVHAHSGVMLRPETQMLGFVDQELEFVPDGRHS